ncbi:MAG TPA: hypothetical protein VFF65_04970 [Phycisphaerales bacterium]|nr:hypothetical protein [Phycisphaerales bacterium]
MGERSLGQWLCVCALAAAGGCAGGAREATDARGEPAAAKPTETSDLVARSADAMARYWGGAAAPSAEDLTPRATEPTAPRAAEPARSHEPAATGASVPPPASDLPAKHEAPAPVADGLPASAPTTTPAPAPAAALPAPGIAGFFAGAALAAPAAAEAAPRLRISNLALCSKVEAFGRFTRLESAPLTGRPVALLVYTQVEGFGYRTLGGEVNAPGADEAKTQWVVDLGQTVVVYRLSADGKQPDEQVLYVPELPCRDVATGKRRDHFLVQRIDLSPWLVAGKYAVKVTLRDKATGQVDERLSEIVLR